MYKPMRCLTAVYLVLGWLVTDTNAQQTKGGDRSVPLAILQQTWNVFAVDDSASQAGRLTTSSASTFVAGPIEIHRPQVKSVRATGNSAPWVTPVNHSETLAHVGEVEHSGTVTDLLGSPSGVRHEIVASSGMGLAMPAPRHHVIRAPRDIAPAEIHSTLTSHSGPHTHGIHEHAAALKARHEETHPEHLAMRRRVQGEPATIPHGLERSVWKQPYSYGYFGASGSRQWSLQHGYRERHSQWTRR